MCECKIGKMCLECAKDFADFEEAFDNAYGD